VDHLSCDRCGHGLLLDAPVRYEVRIEVKAAYDPLELTEEDLARAEQELHAVLERLQAYSATQAQDEVYREFHFDLCASCQQAFLAEPLGRPLRR
jgi:DNA-binding GntR family transcriptional regulator